nr:MAG TPA: hypothetical protein [Caudoviricetes sp.]
MQRREHDGYLRMLRAKEVNQWRRLRADLIT